MQIEIVAEKITDLLEKQGLVESDMGDYTNEMQKECFHHFVSMLCSGTFFVYLR